MDININELKIAYTDEGKGDKLIIFLHGWGACKENFTESINLLKSKYRCIALDLPGFGESGKLSRSFTVDDYTDVVENFINKIISKEWHEMGAKTNVILVGHSFGGRIMIKLNNRERLPFNIYKNIFIDAAGIKHETTLAEDMRVAAFKGMKNILNIIPGSEEEKKERIDKLRSKFGSSDYKNAEPIMRETLVKTVNEDLTPLLSGIKAESLLIWGDKDTATPIEDAKIFEKNIKGSGLVVLKGCGHFSFVEDRYTYLRVLEAFLLKN